MQTKEIDIIARWGVHYSLPSDPSSFADVSVEAFIQLKRIAEGGFVGFLGGQPRRDIHALRAERAEVVAGCPSIGVLAGGTEYEQHLNDVTSKDSRGGPRRVECRAV